MKVCTNCSELKPLSEYHKNSKRLGQVKEDAQCKECTSSRRKQYRLDNKEKIRAENKRRNPGWDIDRYNQQLELQDSRCAICKTNDPGLSDWCCDHCHDSDRPRGLLCVRCNAGLGYFRDNPEYLQSAIEYLNKWQEATSHVTP